MSYPQPLPADLYPALDALTPPFALALAFDSPQLKAKLPTVLIVASPYHALTWAKMINLKIGVSQLGTLTAFGAIYCLAVDLYDEPDQPVGCTTTLDLEVVNDLELLRLISHSERMGVGFADTRRMLQGIKTIAWSDRERKEAASFIDEAQYHNAIVKRNGNFDRQKARAAFDQFYEARLGPLRPLEDSL